METESLDHGSEQRAGDSIVFNTQTKSGVSRHGSVTVYSLITRDKLKERKRSG